MVIQILTVGLLFVSLFTDILHLRDGNRHRGTLVREDDKVVVFRIEAGGGASAVRRFDRRDVVRIEYRVSDDAPDPEKRTEDVAETPGPAGESAVLNQMLREAFELIADGDKPAALRALQRIVSRADRVQLLELDAMARRVRGGSLAGLVAEMRIAAALEAGKGRGFEIRFATSLERASLAEQLEALQNGLGSADVGGRPLLAWTIEEYGRLDAHARLIVRHAQLFAGVVGARLKFDERLAAAGPVRADLVRLRRQMADLATHIASMEGYTNPIEDAAESDPTLEVARRLLEESRAASQPTSGPATQPGTATQPMPDTQPVGTPRPTSGEDWP